jgi:hypothetical protein
LEIKDTRWFANFFEDLPKIIAAEVGVVAPEHLETFATVLSKIFQIVYEEWGRVSGAKAFNLKQMVKVNLSQLVSDQFKDINKALSVAKAAVKTNLSLAQKVAQIAVPDEAAIVDEASKLSDRYEYALYIAALNGAGVTMKNTTASYIHEEGERFTVPFWPEVAICHTLGTCNFFIRSHYTESIGSFPFADPRKRETTLIVSYVGDGVEDEKGIYLLKLAQKIGIEKKSIFYSPPLKVERSHLMLRLEDIRPNL